MINLIFVFVFLLPHPHSATVFTENNPLIYSSVLEKDQAQNTNNSRKSPTDFSQGLQSERENERDLYSPRNDPDREMISNPEMIPN